MNSCACAARAAASISLARRVRRAVRDVGGDRVVEQHRLLRHERDLLAQRPQRHVADVDAVDEDRALRDVVEPRNQIDERRLARAAQADERDDLPGPHRERHVSQHEPVRRRRRRQSRRRGTRRGRGDAAARGAPGFSRTSLCVSSISKMRSAAAIVCCSAAFTRLSFLIGPYIMNAAARNAVNSPGVSLPERDLARAVPERADRRQAADELHQRRQRRQRARDLHVRAIQQLGRAAEARRLARLGAERLDDAMSREALGGQVRDVLELFLAAPRRPAHALPEPHERIDDERRRRHADERQMPVDNRTGSPA